MTSRTHTTLTFNIDGTIDVSRETYGWRDLPLAPIGAAPSPLPIGTPPPPPVATPLLSSTAFEDITYTQHIDGRTHTALTSYSRVRTRRDLSDPTMTNWATIFDTVLAELINTVPQWPPLNPLDHTAEAHAHNMAMMFGTLGRDLVRRERI